jgi:hypothetical protein
VDWFTNSTAFYWLNGTPLNATAAFLSPYFHHAFPSPYDEKNVVNLSFQGTLLNVENIPRGYVCTRHWQG